jgi:hypothetical protein
MTATRTPDRPGAPEPPEDEASYGTRVEDAFIAERGTPFLLAPKDWQLISGWRESGIPADTVIRAVRGAFEKKRARGDLSKISSLSYCANAVEVLWEMERRGLVGAHGPGRGPEGEPYDAEPRLRELAASLRAAEGEAPAGVDAAGAAAALRAAREAVGALDPGSGLEALEEALGKVEKTLLKTLEKALGDPERERLAREVAEEAGDVERLPKETRRRILSALRGRAVRRAFGLSPLTLLAE